METKQKRELNRRLPLALVLPFLLVGLFEVLKGNRPWMDAWVFGVLAPVEHFWGKVWGVFPFSMLEVSVAAFLIFNAVWVIRAVVLALRKREGKPLLRRLLALAAVWLWLWAGLDWLWNTAYSASTFSERSGLTARPSSVEELAAITRYFAQNAARLSTQVARDGDGHFAEDLSSCFDRGKNIYVNLSAEFPCLEAPGLRAKPLVCSRLQSILGFTGMYFPFTGEANVNVDAPACLIPATIGHEMAHQRLVASELECNFIGIAACTSSGDVVFQYSGYLMGLIHLSNALYPVDREAWKSITEYFTPELAVDWNDNNAYWAALESPVEDAAGKVYDGFLKGNDQELGMLSYGACVDLLTAYYGPAAAR